MEEPRFESLGDEGFQQFCQSLLSHEELDLQALEVGLPDGGRDAFLRRRSSRQTREWDYGIYQVKFVRSAKRPTDPEKWIADVLKPELPKINQLAEQGATSYRLITNAPGSPHLGSGAVDKVDRYLAEHLPIPADCWWRNDLMIRVAKHPELRWGYPALLTPTDILRELIAIPPGEGAQRRTNAVQAFLIAQYKDERLVRFKQVELQDELLNVFIDVPVTATSTNSRQSAIARQMVSSLRLELGKPGVRLADGERSVGAADFLFDRRTDALPHVVIEGAPGQGKSTLAQYLCQVHRMRLLRKGVDLRRVSKRCQKGPIRLPFKVDLRDFATFLGGHDPYKDDPEWHGILSEQPRTLEGFLTGLIRRSSGGARFEVSDLHAVASASHVLVVLDGLDEVADLKDRELVVEATEAAKGRLEELALGLQTVVTSRPAAFSNSPGFSPNEVPHLQLVSIPRELAMEYSERWADARHLSVKEKRRVKNVLEKQLKQAHIRDLARNPMQLAILLTLIRTKGDSLPDKRTDLYTSYMRIFFDREAEKAEVVRDNREELEALHEYLAWRLHSSAEVDSSAGSISETELRAEVVAYLNKQDLSSELEDELFKGVVGRIMALVSRVQGRYEFEVQPLREYFAAAYLYKTAQISTVGHEKPGDLLARFDGLARNPFWLNVVRFYAGFYNSGQLPSLIYRLKALRNDSVWTKTGRPRMLAAMFLGDWSFAPDRDSREDAIKMTLDGLGIRHDFSVSGGFGSGQLKPLLPAGAGREHLVERCWTLLDDQSIPMDRESALKALCMNLEMEAFPGWLKRVEGSTGAERTRWLRLGYAELLSRFSPANCELLWNDNFEQDFDRRACWMVSSGLGREVESDADRTAAFIRGLISGKADIAFEFYEPSWLSLLSYLLHPYRMHDWAHYQSLAVLIRDNMTERRRTHLSPMSRRVKDLVTEHVELLESGRHHFEVIARLVELCRQEWGEGWGLYRLVFSLIGSEGRPQRRGSASDLFDTSTPLLQRYRHARARGGRTSIQWWLDVLDRPPCSLLDQKGALVAALSWPSGEALRAVLEPATAILRSLDDDDFLDVCHEVERLSRNRGAGRAVEVGENLLMKLHPRTALALAYRDPQRFGSQLFQNRFRYYRGSDPAVSRFVLDSTFSGLHAGEFNSSRDLTMTRRLYRRAGFGGFRGGERKALGMHPRIASAIMDEPESYPLRLVQFAEQVCAGWAGTEVAPLVDIAAAEKWLAG